MSLYKRGNYWWISMWRNGRHIQVSTKLKDKKPARAVEQALRIAGTAQDGLGRRLSSGMGNGEGKGKELVLGLLRAVYGDSDDLTALHGVWDEYLNVMKVKGKVVTPKNLRDKKSCLDKFIEWATKARIEYIGQVDGSVAQRYALHLAKSSASGKRRKNIILHLSAVWNAIQPNHRDIVNPWPVVSPSNTCGSKRVGFTKEEESRILKACKDVHPQWYIASMIARYTGLRYGDVCRLSWGNINFVKGLITITPSKTKNTSKVTVRIPMVYPLRKAMENWRDTQGRHTEADKVLPWLREYGPKDDRRFSTVLAKAGIDHTKYSFHSWRHTLASRMAENGASIEVRQKVLGHTTREMAEHYNSYDYVDELKKFIEA